jgi:hypothetical protein
LTITHLDSMTGAASLAITIPSLGLNNIALQDFGAGYGATEAYGATFSGGQIQVFIQRLDYVAIAFWDIVPTGGAFPSNEAFAAAGYTTQAGQMPATGTASYSGPVIGEVRVPPAGFPVPRFAILTGSAALTVNFATGGVTGRLTDMMSSDGSAWDSVGLTGTVGGRTLAGTTSVLALPGFSPYTLSSSATGQFNGQFFGPAGQDIGAAWTLSDGNNGSAEGVIGVENTSTPTPTPVPTATYSFQPAAPGTVGTNPNSQFAVAGGPTFTALNGTLPATGTAFPILESAITVGASVTGPDTTTNGEGATLIFNGANGSGGFNLAIAIPSLGITSLALTDTGTTGVGGAEEFEGALPGGGDLLVEIGRLNYVAVGLWSVLPTGNPLQSSNAAFGVFGYQTQSVPTSGTATYTGPVLGLVGAPNGSVAANASLTGTATLNVNFAAGVINGQLSNMIATPFSGAPQQPWDSVAVTAAVSGIRIVQSAVTAGNGGGFDNFTGTTSVVSAPASGSFALAAGATGSFKGNFYGPNADEIGAVWTLYDGTNSAFGVVGAENTTPAPTPTPTAAYTVGPASAATVGSNTTTEVASTNGPTFSGGNGVIPPNGSAFAFLQSTMQFGANSLTADTATNAAGATLTIANVDTQTGALTLTLSIPSLDVNNVTLTAASNGVFQGTASNGSKVIVSLGVLDYSAVAIWSVIPSGDPEATNVGFAASGYTTPTSAMPTTGSAFFRGYATGLVSAPDGASHAEATVTGTAGITANFATGVLTGSLTGMNLTPVAGGAEAPWDTVDLTATISGASFAGSTSVDATSVPHSGAFVLKSTATGFLNGQFYGPTPSELAGVWTLYDGSETALGVISAGPKAPPEGGFFIVGAPDTPTVGVNPPTTPAHGLQTAAPGGPSFTGTPSLPAPGTVFAATQTAMQVTPTFAVADDATTAGGLTETVLSKGGYELKIPSLGIDEHVPASGDVTLADGGHLRLTNLSPGGNLLNFVNFNQWSLLDSNGQLTSETGFAMIGYQTPLASMPSSGTATYSGVNNVSGTLFVTLGSEGSQEAFNGNGSMTANFATGTASGSFTSLNYHSADVTGWNTVNFSASISGDKFTGSTSAPAFSAVGAGKGAIAGDFFGPVANEAGAIWTLTDGNDSAIGVFGAPQPSSTVTTISAFAPASLGANPPTLDAGNNGFQTGQVPTGSGFPLLQSAVSIADSEGVATIGPDSTTNAQGAILTTRTDNSQQLSLGQELKIPSLGIDLTFTGQTAQAANGEWVTLQDREETYTVFGQWAVSPTQTGEATTTSWFSFGYQTPAAGMPTSGTATYLAFAEGSVYAPAATQGASPAYITGDLVNGQANLVANFAAGTVTGSFTGITVTSSTGQGPTDPWNGFSVNATISGAAFAGTSAVNSTPPTTDAYTLSPTATGTINGTFNGPSANEVGAVWTLHDATHSASGAIYGPKQNTPSDRRLKRDVHPLGRHVIGARLYRYRYLGDDRVFVGVMAQELLEDPRLAGAVVREAGGFLAVDYGRLGIRLEDAGAMRSAGEAAKRIWFASMAMA